MENGLIFAWILTSRETMIENDFYYQQGALQTELHQNIF